MPKITSNTSFLEFATRLSQHSLQHDYEQRLSPQTKHREEEREMEEDREMEEEGKKGNGNVEKDRKIKERREADWI